MRPHTLWTHILDTPWTPAIFQSISLFLSFGFAYFHLYIYILPYLTHTKRIEERFIPPIVWDYCNFTATSLRLCFHCDCVLHLVLQLLAIDIRPIIVFSIDFLSHHIISCHFISHCIVHFTSSHCR